MVQIQKTVKRKGFKPVGIFLFGMLFGLIFTLGSLFGLGFWAYKSMTINKLEKLTKKEINIGNESIKNVTIETFVKNISGIANNLNSYTIEQIESDFNISIIGENGFISSSMYGLDLTPLKKCNKSNILEGVENIVENAPLNTIMSYLEKESEELGLFGTILDKRVTYYYNVEDSKLYSNLEKTEAVTFDYKVQPEGSDVKIYLGSNTSYDQVTDGEINPQLKFIPLTEALNKIDTITNTIPVYELLELTRTGLGTEADPYVYKTESNTPVTGVLKAIAGKTISELSNDETYNNLHIYEVMDYKKIGNKYYSYNSTTETYSSEVTGVIKALCDSTVGDLTNRINNLTLGEALDVTEEDATGVIKALHGKKITELNDNSIYTNLTIADVMDYKYDEETNKYYSYNPTTETYSTEVTGIMATLASSSLASIETSIDDIKAKDIIDPETPILKLFDNTELETLTINGLPSAVVSKINDATIDDLVTAGIITEVDTTNAHYNTIKDLTILDIINPTT